MKPRPLNELYQLLHDYIKENPESISIVGICSVITRLSELRFISDDERRLLRHNFALNKPTILLHREFFLNDSFNKNRNYTFMYWWKFGSIGKEQRLEFLKYLIDNHQIK